MAILLVARCCLLLSLAVAARCYSLLMPLAVCTIIPACAKKLKRGKMPKC
jgi:hypothetical protein